jgi:hypothetical protein
MGKEKVVVGIPFYCHAFKLMIPFMHGYHAYSNGAGECDSSVYACVSIIAMFINNLGHAYVSIIAMFINNLGHACVSIIAMFINNF